MKKIAIFIYYVFASHLPSSYFPFGKLFNSIRINCLKKFITIGHHCKVQKNVIVGDGNNIIIGNYCQINENVKLDNVQIGEYVMIAPGVTILGKMHESGRTDIPMLLQGEKPVNCSIIENDVWIGTNAILMPGIHISKGCIIGAGAVVTKSCDANGIYVGIPAKMIKKRFTDT